MRNELQEVYDTVVNHHRTQGRQATSNGSCRYRTADGLKCAIGCLIPDDKYDSTFEGKGVYSPSGPGFLFGYGEKLHLLGSFQLLHDNASNWTYTGVSGIALEDVANRHKLKYKEPST